MNDQKIKTTLKSIVGSIAGMCSCRVVFDNTLFEYGIVGEKFTRLRNKITEIFKIDTDNVTWVTVTDVFNYVKEQTNG